LGWKVYADTKLYRGLRKHNPDVKIIAADPLGSILAMPDTLNEANEQYKVEGIGYDFIPDVLDRPVVDVWYKTNDKDSFLLSRRLIREEGLLVGGSCGSAMSAALQAAKGLSKDKVVVVILPDSIRSYLSKVSFFTHMLLFFPSRFPHIQSCYKVLAIIRTNILLELLYSLLTTTGWSTTTS